MKREKFKILKTGNFYFPFINRKEKFIVEGSVEVALNKKEIESVEFCLKNKNLIHFGMLAKPIWDALKNTLKKELKRDYKDCWFVPNNLFKLSKGYVCNIDILRKVK